MIRIAFVELPRMLRDVIVSAVEAEPDMEVVDDVGSADVVIATSSSLDEANALQLVETEAKRVVLLGERGDATLYFCRPQKEPLGELSPESLVRVLTGAAGGI